jgi:tRNA threonylcarbamoyladenosine modification (KEOPS) complex  Pcc1 subunit
MHSENLMATRAKASVKVTFKDEKQLVASLAALRPEVNAPVTRRARVDLKKKDNLLILSVDADDTVALRATVNAYLRWIASTVNVIELIEHL